MNDTAGDSYDPRTWLKGWEPSARVAAATKAPAVALPSLPGLPTMGGDRRMTMALAGSAVILIVGALAAHFSRPAGGPVAAGSEIAATPDAPPPIPRIRRTLVLSGSADLADALLSSGIARSAAEGAAAAARTALQPTGEIRAVLTVTKVDGVTTLERLEASNPDSSGVVVSPAANGSFAASAVAAQLSSKIIVRRGTMDGDSFYSSAVAAGITDSLIPDFAKALAFDFDFQREVHAGDAFEAAFDQPVDSAGQPVGAPKLLYASLSSQTKSAAVYAFAGKDGKLEWFDGSGRSIIRALMRTPVDGARVSSTFGMRVHPVLGYMKLHKGTDFAAPIGTPIYAAGNGTVTWSGMKGPNGNLVIIHHDNGWLTYYLHQNRILPQITVGARVVQGQQIGEIGTTGRSTGPHLHYEVHINDEPVDSMSIKTESGETLSGKALIDFGKERDRIDVSRAAQAS